MSHLSTDANIDDKGTAYNAKNNMFNIVLTECFIKYVLSACAHLTDNWPLNVGPWLTSFTFQQTSNNYL